MSKIPERIVPDWNGRPCATGTAGPAPLRDWSGRPSVTGTAGPPRLERQALHDLSSRPLNPPPEINVEDFNIFFFRLSARSSNTHQRGLIWSAIFIPLNFREKRRLHIRGSLFYLLEKNVKIVHFHSRRSSL